MPNVPDPTDPVPPETRDWTTITREPCAACGFDPSTVTPATAADRIRATIRPWAAVPTRPGSTARPAPDVWSPLEYACHVRDVCRTFTERLDLIVRTSARAHPARFPDWDQNAAQVAGRYNAQDPDTVAREYAAAAAALADGFAAVHGDAWGREGARGDGARFTALSLAAYLVHDLEHHLVDVGC
ncbi:DinB family protein [Tomitella fengzijianii]|uniref:DinB family protein n=1 Tax=Tomitella fengzijianii TaxID=2597660 RepID=UPI00131E55B1|nr:DinB family protein [Tomitella fengzijianii]